MSQQHTDGDSFGGSRTVLKQIGDRPLYLGNQCSVGADGVSHGMTETFAEEGVPVLSVNKREQPLTTHHHPIHDGPGNDPAAFEAAMDTARELYQAVLKGDRPGPMMVNCAAGISRSTTTIAVTLAATEEVSFETGVQKVKTYRGRASPHPALVELAETYLEDVPDVPPTPQ